MAGCRMMLCMGRILNVLDLRDVDYGESSKLERSMFGDYTRSLAISGNSLKDDTEAAKRVERLYREAIRMFNRYDWAANSVPTDYGGACHHMPIGIIVYSYGASLVASREKMHVEYFDGTLGRRVRRKAKR